MVKMGEAASCNYVEASRKATAIAFVVDAFNGKVDSILSKTKKDNFGTQEQRIKDAAKEEDMLRKAMEKVQQKIATATEAKIAEFEAKLQELQERLTEAEARGQRAISMAQ